MVVLFLLQMPVAFTMAFVGVVGFCIIRGPEAGLNVWRATSGSRWKYIQLTVIPMFVLMGSVAYHSGMSGRLYDGAYTLFGRLRGGLAMATVVATAGFSAICGSTSATAAAMGKVAIPEMRRHGYDPGLACGCMAAAGSLGIMIPPSTIFIIYGDLGGGSSVGKLFVAGVVPGLILGDAVHDGRVDVDVLQADLGAGGRQEHPQREAQGSGRYVGDVVLFLVVIVGLFSVGSARPRRRRWEQSRRS